MQVELFFVTFNLNCRLHAVAVRQPSNRHQIFGRFGIFSTESEPIFGFPHNPTD